MQREAEAKEERRGGEGGKRGGDMMMKKELQEKYIKERKEECGE